MSDIRFISEQFFLSTAEYARAYFYGLSQVVQTSPSFALPDGTYRVIDGILCRVISGVPSSIAELKK